MKRILGLPRWLVGGLAVGILLSYLFFANPPKPEHVPSPLVGPIIEGLRTTSVYAAPGAPPLVDVARARHVIGDRPIVVAVLDRTPLPHENMSLERQNLCEDVADATPTNIVMVFAQDSREYGSSICMGPEFSNPTNPVDADDFDLGLTVAAETAWEYRATATNLTPQIEEYVLAFDAQAAKKYPEFVPRRAIVPPAPPTASALQTRQIVLAIVGLIVAVIAVFALLQLVVRLVRRRQDLRAANDSRTVAMTARLNRLADNVLRPDKPRGADDAAHQAEVARRYLLALQQFEQDGPNDETETQVRELEELVK
ncbi:hypothetical protein [Labedaea rhizosphaerae]|uniref:Uncharacterized protein n=1 Tax=Labedaea rhizosphaerae TaxID=598644 RepID=A0A4R6SPI0_LABRH|nr:hypothetical protein [Labedaea rhizosphaerae]TDQ05934.1 hypothetical protein EV186_1011912 [Labedaea rhizosphaerae]